jgi:predicted histidine transporter YuiF (NhaC family)|tara:strand:+ start:1351 stop:1629 length:279 start_codon:yes stop_codon:yes gene_type:complete
MEILYNNKFIVSVLLGLLTAVVFYNFNKINHDKMNTIETDEDQIYINNDNQNKDYSLYVFLGVSLMIFGILQVTQDNIDEVFTEIDVGEPPF